MIDENAFQVASRACNQGPVHSLRAAIEAYETAKTDHIVDANKVDSPCSANGEMYRKALKTIVSAYINASLFADLILNGVDIESAQDQAYLHQIPPLPTLPNEDDVGRVAIALAPYIYHNEGDNFDLICDQAAKTAIAAMPRPLNTVELALENAAKILANFKPEGERDKLDEWQACYAMLFKQMTELGNAPRPLTGGTRQAGEKQIRAFQLWYEENIDGYGIDYGDSDDITHYFSRVFERESGWQPIETAPKNGTEIMVCDAEFIKIGSWYKAAGDWCWWSDGKRFAMITPTHWMPLPALPPEPEGDGK